MHPRGAADVLFGCAGDEDECAEVGPVRTWRYESCVAVFSVGSGPCVPGDVTPEEAAAGGAGTLPRDEGEVFGGVGESVEVCDGADEGCEACGGGGEACGCREVVG